jgi:hypothetical protein
MLKKFFLATVFGMREPILAQQMALSNKKANCRNSKNKNS